MVVYSTTILPGLTSLKDMDIEKICCMSMCSFFKIKLILLSGDTGGQGIMKENIALR